MFKMPFGGMPPGCAHPNVPFMKEMLFWQTLKLIPGGMDVPPAAAGCDMISLPEK